MTLASLLTLGAAQSWNLPLVLLLIKATVLLVAALGITLAMQRASAGARHLVWLVTLATVLLVPALAAWSPLRLEILPAPRTAAAPEAAAPEAAAPEAAAPEAAAARSAGASDFAAPAADIPAPP